MAAKSNGNEFPWFTINEFLSKAVTVVAPIDVTSISAVAFDVDVNITVGTLPTAFPLSAGTPLGIDSSTQSIKVDVNAFMFAMGGK